MDINEILIRNELSLMVQNLNFLDLLQLFTSKFFSKLLASVPTKEQADNLKNYKDNQKKNDDKNNNKKKKPEKKFNSLEYEIFSSQVETVELISNSYCGINISHYNYDIFKTMK